MNRVRGPSASGGADPPVYDDPLDVETHPLITFKKVAGQKTSLTADWANMVTEELNNLVEGLGWTLDSEDDSQLASAIGPALYNVRIPVSPFSGTVTAGWGPLDIAPSAVVMQTTTASASMFLVPLLPVGSQIVSFGARAIDDGSTETLQLDLRRTRSESNASLDLSGELWSSSYSSQTKVLASPHLVEVDYSYLIRAYVGGSWNGTDARIESAWVIAHLAAVQP